MAHLFLTDSKGQVQILKVDFKLKIVKEEHTFAGNLGLKCDLIDFAIGRNV